MLYEVITWTLEKTVTDIVDDNIDIVSVSSASDSVVFKPTGTMTATTISLRNSKGDTKDITSSIVGRIHTE